MSRELQTCVRYHVARCDIDTLIAATALERQLTVVTMDGDFLRVSGLGVILLDRTSLAVNQQRAPAR